MTLADDSTVRLGKVWIPGQRVKIIAGPFVGIVGEFVALDEERGLLIRIDEGVFVRSPEVFVKRDRHRR
jgi:transcription antitermination factor NusG